MFKLIVIIAMILIGIGVFSVYKMYKTLDKD